MKYCLSCLTFILSLYILCGCTSGSGDPLMAEAFDEHQLAMAIHDSVLIQLDTLDQRITAMHIKDSATISYIKAVKAIKQDFEIWDESMVSVPGYESEHEHDHDHNHEHDHDHENSPNDLKDMSSEQILALQKGLRLEIQRIEKKADSLIGIVFDEDRP